jgi:hypothetical protein
MWVDLVIDAPSICLFVALGLHVIVIFTLGMRWEP